jgi:Family of unknown function (DUF5713)
MAKNQTALNNADIQNYSFLNEMYKDSYFPTQCVDKAKAILIQLCFEIEETKPQNLQELYKLTHIATDKFNDLQDDFYQNGSEIETAARDCIAVNFERIANAYCFEADIDELTATRDW